MAAMMEFLRLMAGMMDMDFGALIGMLERGLITLGDGMAALGHVVEFTVGIADEIPLMPLG